MERTEQMAMGFSEAVGGVGNREHAASLQRLQRAATAIQCARSEPERQRALQTYQRLDAEFQQDTCDHAAMRGLQEACATIGESLWPPKKKYKKQKKKKRDAFNLDWSSDSSDAGAGAPVPFVPPPPPPPPLEPALQEVVDALVDEVVAEEVLCVAQWCTVRAMASDVIVDEAIDNIFARLVVDAVYDEARTQVKALEEEFTQQAMTLGERVLEAAQGESIESIRARRPKAPESAWHFHQRRDEEKEAAARAAKAAQSAPVVGTPKD